MPLSQANPTPKPDERLRVAVEAYGHALQRATQRTFRVRLIGLAIVMSVAMTAFVIVLKAG